MAVGVPGKPCSTVNGIPFCPPAVPPKANGVECTVLGALVLGALVLGALVLGALVLVLVPNPPAALAAAKAPDPEADARAALSGPTPPVLKAEADPNPVAGVAGPNEKA